MESTRKSELLPAFVAELLLITALATFLLIVAGIMTRDDTVNEVVEAPATRILTTPAPHTVFPDISLADTVGERKKMFLNFIQDYVDARNRQIMRDRMRLLSIEETWHGGGVLADASHEWLLDLAARFRVAESDFDNRQIWLEELLIRVDIVPASLVLAQAANESAWGTSRFVREGNNVFGQWCFDPGCGIVPRQRRQGAKHEVRSFATLHDAMEAYFLNINSNNSYQFFRELRRAMKLQQRELDSLVLAFGLSRYSQRGHGYVEELQTIIVQNNLTARDGDYSTAIGMID